MWIKSRLVIVLLVAGVVARSEPIGALPGAALGAVEDTAARKELERRITAAVPEGLIRTELGVTRNGTSISCVLSPEDFDFHTPKSRVLIVGSLDGTGAAVDATLGALKRFYRRSFSDPLRRRWSVSAIPCANPDGFHAGTPMKNGSGGNPMQGYPPTGEAYHSETDPEAAYVWRWIGMNAPDFVIVVRGNDSAQEKEVSRPLIAEAMDERLQRLAEALGTAGAPELSSDSLAAALGRTPPSNTGTIPAIGWEISGDVEFLPDVLSRADGLGFKAPSPARQEIQRRLGRSPVSIARELGAVYGHDLSDVQYIKSLAVIARARLGALTDETAHLEAVRALTRPYVTGTKPALKPKLGGSNISGYLVFADLADRTRDEQERERLVTLVREAADLAFDDAGEPREAMPTHSEMSDALFMGGPILARAGALTGERKYFDMCARHIEFMRGITARDDWLYGHSPLDKSAWGRGNGFPALGLALVLSDFPKNHPKRAELLKAFHQHMFVLRRKQDPTGCWHQVIDRPESYRELTSTCMILFAMTRGLRRGWLEPIAYGPVVERAWYALRTRVADDGNLVDVCTGTGKQTSLRAYYDRAAILGRNDRGGAMAMMAATEYAAWKK